MLIDSQRVVSAMLVLFYPNISKYRQKPDINETNTNPSLRRITAGSLDFSCAASVTSICGCFSVSGIMPNILSCEHPRNSKLVIHHVYAAGLNSQTGFADYRVAYRMTKEAVGVASLLSRGWQLDRLVHIPGELGIMESAALSSH